MTQKLSTLVREGSKSTRKIEGTYVRLWFDPNDGPVLYCCALGAAYIGAGGGYTSTGPSLSDIVEKLEEATGTHVVRDLIKTPEVTDSGIDTMTVFTAVVLLNDRYRWDRERIADYLEQQGY